MASALWLAFFPVIAEIMSTTLTLAGVSLVFRNFGPARKGGGQSSLGVSVCLRGCVSQNLGLYHGGQRPPPTSTTHHSPVLYTSVRAAVASYVLEM